MDFYFGNIVFFEWKHIYLTMVGGSVRKLGYILLIISITLLILGGTQILSNTSYM